MSQLYVHRNIGLTLACPAEEGERVVAALDDVFSRGWG